MIDVNIELMFKTETYVLLGFERFDTDLRLKKFDVCNTHEIIVTAILNANRFDACFV